MKRVFNMEKKNDLRKLQLEELQILEEFIKVCNENTSFAIGNP